MYADDDYLALSGIQHFAYCRRQWGLIHIEGLWSDSLLTVLGDLMHERAHDEGVRERRGDILRVRGMTVWSSRLGVWGKCDVIEFKKSLGGHPLFGEDGLWRPVPVEYKRGRRKDGDEDRMQLCAQAMCLEDMFACEIAKGYLYYGESKSRELVELTSDLRDSVEACLTEMHNLYNRKHVPAVRYSARCRSCSLAELCLPRTRSNTVEDYMNEILGGDV